MTPPGPRKLLGTLADSELARQARAGSLDAFDELVVRYHEGVFAFLVALTRHRQDAEDLTQETFLRAWQSFRRFDPERPLRPWLLTIGRRLSIDALRRGQRAAAAEPTPEAFDPWQAAAHDPPARRLWALASQHLSADSRAALWLHYREELPVEQVARILGKRVGAVKTMLHRARRTLAAAAGQPATTPPPLPATRPPALPASGETTPPPLPHHRLASPS